MSTRSVRPPSISPQCVFPRREAERLGRLAAELLHVPVAYVGTAEDGVQWIAGGYGIPPQLDGTSISLAETICSRVLEEGASLAVDNVKEDPTLRDLARVRQLDIAAYLGLPLRASGGIRGTFCAVDHLPRTWSPDAVALMADLGGSAELLLRSRDQARRAAEPLRRQRRKNSLLRRELRDSAAFGFVVEHSLAGIYIIQDGRFAYVNPTLAELLGYSPGELESLPVMEVVAPEDRERIEEGIRRRISGEVEQLHHTFNALTRTGERVPVEVLGSAAEFRGRAAAVGTLLDIRERKRAEEAISRGLERYQLVVRATGSVVREWDLSSGNLSWEGPAAALFREPVEMLGDSVDWWYARIAPDDRERVIGGLQVALEGSGESWSDEYGLRRADGTYASVLDCCWVVRDDQGAPLRMVGSMLEVTQRKRVEESQRFLARASSILDSSLDLQVTFSRLVRLVVPELADYCLVDLLEDDGSLRRVAALHRDPALEGILRKDESHSPESDLSRHPALRVARSGEPVLVRECTEETIRQIGHDPEHLRGLRALRLSSFLIVPLTGRDRIHGVLTLGSSDPERHFGPFDLLLAQDVGRRAGSAVEHARLYQAARGAIEARDDVLRLVSHDLRNPISSIRLGAAMLLDQDEDRRGGRTKVLEVIERASEEMNRMIDDLLDVTTMEGGHFAVNAAAEDPVALLADARDLLLPIAQQRRITLNMAVPAGLPAIRADPHQILRVLSNLVGNAIKFAPEGGWVRLEAERHGSAVRFSICDNGPGIPPDQLPHVFDRYWQARRGDRRGTGLGLAIAKGLVEAHGGDIWAETRPGEGARFFFTVPCAPAD
jgi:PAS domain S-box-containing protein